jgi:quinol monooxygenase YgiN
MPAFLLHIQIRPGCEARALETLGAIEESAHRDRGCVAFTWLRERDDPLRFTLFEHWRTQADLEAHLQSSPERWQSFTPCLAAEPRSVPVIPVRQLGAPLGQEEVERFAGDWFERLNRHADLAEMLPLIADDGLEMVFPERTLRSRADFADWYAAVGRAYRDQDHVVKRVQVTPGPAGTDVDVTVTWRAVATEDGSRIAANAEQSWTLVRSQATGEPAIRTYRVRTFQPIG